MCIHIKFLGTKAEIEQQLDDSCPGAPRKLKRPMRIRHLRTIGRQKKTTKNKGKSKGKELP